LARRWDRFALRGLFPAPIDLLQKAIDFRGRFACRSAFGLAAAGGAIPAGRQIVIATAQDMIDDPDHQNDNWNQPFPLITHEPTPLNLAGGI
jgi:hypothetical protein